ncbi:MAG: ShlB/FhaC/HecB family hemolysin secretion/activation protein [Candidatus Omnitrophota bacterium]
MRRVFFTLYVVIALFAGGAFPAYAAPLSGAGAGVEQRRTEEARESREALARLEKEKKAPEISIAETTLPKGADEKISFHVDRILLTGLTVLREEEIRPLVAPYEKRTLKLSEAKTLAEDITRFYRSKGYITCRAYIPPQKIDSNTLEIRVLEGTLGEVRVQGVRYFRTNALTRFVDGLKKKVLQIQELEKRIIRMNLHPDREVKAVILPGDLVGTSDLLLDVDSRFPIHIGGEVNNFGTKFTGTERYSFWVRDTQLLGLEDILAVRVQFGENVYGIGAQYVFPIGPYDTQIGASFNRTTVEIGREFAVLDINGTAYSAKIFLNQPVLDTEHFDLGLTGGLEYKNVENSVLGSFSSRDDLRMVSVGVNVDEGDPYGRTFMTHDLIFGVPWLGASDKHDPMLSRAGAGSYFLKYQAAMNRIHPVGDSTFLYFKLSAQATPDRLVSAEQYDMGGVYSVRGYPQSDYLADYGYGGSAELRVPCYFIPRDFKLPGTGAPLWNRVNFLAFFDGAYGKVRNPGVGELRSRTYFGAGGGLRVDLPGNWSARFEWAAPTGDRPFDGSSSQYYFTISGELP